MTTAIIDYGMCNLGSVRRAFEECGADVCLTENPKDLDGADHIVLPGVGSFAKGMENLRKFGWTDAIQKNVIEQKKPFLGICLGMQLLADVGVEGGETKGLGLIAGRVEKLVPPDMSVRLPHIGWNEIHYEDSDPLLDKIGIGTDFYFVHSYHFVLNDKSDALAKTPYCGGFVSAVHYENVYGVQFHPEKSQKPGFQLIRNFLQIC